MENAVNKNAYVLSEEELWSLQKYGVRYVVDGDMVVKQTFFGYGATLADTGYVVVGVDENDRYLLADAVVWEDVCRNGSAQDEGAGHDDGQGGEVGVGLCSRKEDDSLVCPPGADGDDHVFVDGV